MKFIHAADIHLDSPLDGLGAYADAPLDLLRTATREAFSGLVSEAIEKNVDFMVLAGDLYDGTWRDHNTGIFFCGEMGRLKKAGIPVYLLYGNHDAESEMTRKLQLPDNVFVFEARKPTTFRIDGLQVALHGQSFRQKETLDNLVTNYPAPVPGWLNVGVLHTALEGNASHARYAPCSLDELHAKGYQYWALGHVHEHKVWRGASTVVFPGNLQGRSVRETGPRGAVLVTADESGVQDVERLFVDVLCWNDLQVNAEPCETLVEVVREVGRAIDALAASCNPGIPLVVRVTVGGRTPAHGELFGLEAQLRAEVLALAAAAGTDRVWIEKVKVRTSPPDDGAAVRARADGLSDLQDVLRKADQDADFLEGLRADLLGLVTKAPIELQEAVPYFKDIRTGDLGELVREICPGLVAHIARAE